MFALFAIVANAQTIVVGDSLIDAKQKFAQTGLDRNDCDPIGDGQWACSDGDIPDNYTPPSSASVSTSSDNVFVTAEGATIAVGNNIAEARKNFAQTGLKRKDCDPIADGQWGCSDRDVPDNYTPPTIASSNSDADLLYSNVFVTAEGATIAIGNNIAEARKNFAQTGLERKDCDPIGDERWACSDQNVPDNFIPPTSLTGSDSSTSTDNNSGTDTETGTESDTGSDTGLVSSGIIVASGSTREEAVARYEALTDQPMVECDRQSPFGYVCGNIENPRIISGEPSTATPTDTSPPSPPIADAPAPALPETPDAAAPEQPEVVDVPAPEQPEIVDAPAPELPQNDDPVALEPALGLANLKQIPATLDNTFKYNANGSSTLVTFTDNNGNLRQLYSFVGHPDRQMYLTIRDFPAGDWETPVNVHAAAMGNTVWEDDNHNNTAVGVAGDGTIFVTGNHHVDRLRMARSNQPFSIRSGFSNVSANEIPGNFAGRVTYPSFAYANSYLYFSYRDQIVGQGNGRFRWVIVRYNHVTGTFDNLSQLNSGSSLRLYISNVASSTDGTTLHWSGVWRDDNGPGSGTENQLDLFHFYSTNNGQSWTQYGLSGNHPLPLIWNERGHNHLGGNDNPRGFDVQQLIWNTPASPVPRNAGSIAVDTNGNPHILNDERDGVLWYHRYTGAQWLSVRSPFESSTDAPFSMGNGKMGALVHRNSDIYFHSLDPNDRSYRDGVLLARGFANSQNNATADVIAVREGWLSTVIMKANNHPPRTNAPSNPQPAFVLSVPIDELENFDTPFVR